MIDTTQYLEQLQLQTELFLQKAVQEWQMMPTEQLSFQPSAGTWSAAQCLEHLNIYGDHYLPEIEKAIQFGKVHGAQPSKNFRSGWLGAYFTRLMQPQQGGALKTKMKSPKNAVPDEHPDARATLATFIDQQEKMLLLLRQAASVNLNNARVPISLSPWIRLKLGDTFGFVIAHIDRHVIQAERSVKGYTFQDAGRETPGSAPVLQPLR